MPDPRADLEAAGRALAEANQARDEAIARVAEVMRRAEGEVSVTEMARLAGVTRVTAYRLLGRS